MGNIIKPKHKGQVLAEIEEAGIYGFDCPACGHTHYFNCLAENEKIGFKTWQFNGDLMLPTISPSLLYTSNEIGRCHSFVENGVMKFCGDSSKLGGQHIKLSPFDYSCSEEYWDK